MDVVVQWMVDTWGWGALVMGLVAYLIIEGGLDIVTDLISDWIREKRK